MRHPVRTRAVVAAFALVTGLGTVAGCGGAGTSVAGHDGKADADGGKPTVGTSEGTPTFGQGIPAGFPRDQVPLLGEAVLSGVKGTAGGPFAWSVVMGSRRAIDDLSTEVSHDFASAGYTVDRATELGDVSIHQFSSDTYEVDVTIARTSDGMMITYIVKDKP